MSFISATKNKIRNAIKAQLEKIYTFFGSLADKCPRCFLGIVVVYACIGYAFLLMFPILILVGIYQIYDAFVGSEIIDWVGAPVWLAVVVLSAYITFHITRIKFAPATGLTIAEEKAPELFKSISRIKDTFKRPEINRVVITGDYDIDVVKTPKWPLPVWSSNTLVIGLPVLQCFTREQFECKLSGIIGQYSKQDNMVTNWLHQLRDIWYQYKDACKKQKGLGLFLPWVFFTVYAPFYSVASVFIARRDEMYADSYALQIFNDEIVLDMVTADTVYRWQLQHRYWPAVDKIASAKPKSMAAPHGKMATSIHNSLQGEKLKAAINEVFEREPYWSEPHASLKYRLDNIGHEEPKMKEHEGDIAAVHYLGSSLTGVVGIVDKLWLKNFLEKNR